MFAKKVTFYFFSLIVALGISFISLRFLVSSPRGSIGVYRELQAAYFQSATLDPWQSAWSEQYSLGYPTASFFQPPGGPDFYHYGLIVLAPYYALFKILSFFGANLGPILIIALGFFGQLIGVLKVPTKKRL